MLYMKKIISNKKRVSDWGFWSIKGEDSVSVIGSKSPSSYMKISALATAEFIKRLPENKQKSMYEDAMKAYQAYLDANLGNKINNEEIKSDEN